MAVVGGGNTAVEEALFLTNFADRVTLIHRRGTLRADKTNQMRLAAHPKITLLYDTVVEEVVGSQNPSSVTGIRTRNLASGAQATLAIDGLFIAESDIRPRPNCSRASSTWMTRVTSARRRIRRARVSTGCSPRAM